MAISSSAEGNLMAQSFDVRQLQLSGEATRVTEGLGIGCCEFSNAAFSISDTGSIAYWSGYPYSKSQLTWFDRTGRPIGSMGAPGYYGGFMPSPNGKFSALERVDFTAKTSDIWLLDMAGGSPSRLTFVNYAAGDPLWSPDSQRVPFTQWTDRLYVKSIRSGVIEEVPFPGGTNSDFPLGWSPLDLVHHHVGLDRDKDRLPFGDAQPQGGGRDPIALFERRDLVFHHPSRLDFRHQLDTPAHRWSSSPGHAAAEDTALRSRSPSR
jgi:hypothetical protein